MLKERESYAYQLGEQAQGIISDILDGYSPPGQGVTSHEYEDEITGAILDRIRSDLAVDSDNYSITPDTYNGNTENDTGADFAILYDVSTPEITLQTGILVQAKRYESGYYSAENKTWSKLVDQCEKMLEYATDSYVIDYSTNEDGVYMLPAASIAGTSTSKFDDFDSDAWLPSKYHRRKPGEVLKPLFLGYIGSEYIYRAVSQATGSLADFRRTDNLKHPDPIYTDGRGEFNEENSIRVLEFKITPKE